MFKFSILFCLLLCSFACNKIAPQKFEANIPDDSIVENRPIPEGSINIRIKEDGSLFLENNEVGKIEDTARLKNQLSAILNSRKTSNATTAVIINASKKIIYNDVVKIIDVAKSLGGEPIGIKVDDLSH